MRQFVAGLTLFVVMCLLAPVSDARAPKPSNFTAAARTWSPDPHARAVGRVDDPPLFFGS